MKGNKYPQRHLEAGLSYSAAKKIIHAPSVYKHEYIDENWSPDTDARRLGRAVHSLALEHEKFDQQYIVMPKVDGRTKAGKALKAEYEAKAIDLGLTMIKEDTHETAKACAESLRNHPTFAALLDNDPTIEQFYKWRDKRDDGILWQAKPDIVAGRIAADIKTCGDARAEAFIRDVEKMYYDVQAALYTDVLEGNGKKIDYFLFACVETAPPYLCAMHVLDDESIAAARDCYRQAGWTFQQCIATGKWPGLERKVDLIGLRPWVLKSRMNIRGGE